MPQPGEIKIGREIGYATGWRFKWDACCVCGIERWVRLDWAGGRCKKCAGKEYSKLYSGANATCWKGGRIQLKSKGYIMIALQSTDFFYSMTVRGYVLEHRLIMAKHQGRNLHPWEIVHHKNHIRNDNRIENLQLVSEGQHKQITILENRLSLLEKRVTMLEAENAILRTQEIKWSQ